MIKYIRVKDLVTKHEKSIPDNASRDGYEVIDKPAMQADGQPLPDKPYIDPKSLSKKSPTPGHPQAESDKENS